MNWERGDAFELLKWICTAANELKKEKTGSQWDVVTRIKLHNDLRIEFRRIFKWENEKYSSWTERYRKISISSSTGRSSNWDILVTFISFCKLS